jgi:uncharacterized protein YcfJ
VRSFALSAACDIPQRRVPILRFLPDTRLGERGGTEVMMNRSLITGLAVGAVVATAGAAVAGYRLMDRRDAPQYAEVLHVSPVAKRVRTPHQVCKSEEVTHHKQARDPHDYAGTAIGAVVGGLLGNQIGGGNGRKIATVAGAAAGGFAGNRIEHRMQAGDTYTTTEQHCSTVYETREEQHGFDVVYRLNGTEHRIHMDHDPGPRIPVHDGQLALDGVAPESAT